VSGADGSAGDRMCTWEVVGVGDAHERRGQEER
jgi:hypothetical protein